MNPSAPEYQSPVPAVRSTNHENGELKYSPAAYVDLLGNDGAWHKAVALFDTGSDVTLIKKNTVQRLNLDRKPRAFWFGTAGSDFRTEDSASVCLWIRCLEKPSSRFNITAIELEKPAHKIPKLGDAILENDYLRLLKPLIPNDSVEVDILLGYDYASLMTPISYLTHATQINDYPIAAQTAMGWYILGPTRANDAPYNEAVKVKHIRIQEDLLNIHNWYEADICGVKPTQLCACSDNEIKEVNFLKHVKKLFDKLQREESKFRFLGKKVSLQIWNLIAAKL